MPINMFFIVKNHWEPSFTDNLRIIQRIYLETEFLSKYNIHIRWVPCHHGMVRPQAVDGEDGLQVWKVAATILSNQSQTPEKV
jgi:hypothetical protein